MSETILKGRVFNCLQYEANPHTGQSFNFTEQNILNCVKHKTITRYAYIRHDKDEITEHDIENSQNLWTEADLGKTKAPHWHIVIETANNQTSVKIIAKWLGIPENMIEVPKGRGAFIDCVEYLRHSDIRQKLNGKHEYAIEEVKANFDWFSEVESLVLRKTKYEKPLTQSEFVKNEVLYNGLTLKEVAQRYPTLYQQEMTTFDKLRNKYLQLNAPLPAHRINYYIQGDSGYGKDTMAYALAKALFPNYGEDAYFEIGGNKVTFDGYDGEPVIIWSEFRADTFVKALGGYENVLQSIDIIPKAKLEHKKYGSVKLINAINIVTSTQPYGEFLKGLIPPKDPSPTQAHRRFPLIIPIHQNDFDVLINAGYLDANTYSEYLVWNNIRGSFASLARQLNDREKARKVLENDLTKHIIGAHNQVEKHISNDEYKDLTDNEIIDLFRQNGYGDTLYPVESDVVYVDNYDYRNEKELSIEDEIMIDEMKRQKRANEDENA